MPEWPSGFLFFLQTNPEFCYRKVIIWSTISSRSYFYWLYRASLSLAAKKYNQSDFGIDHPVMSMCKVVSWVVGKGFLLWVMCSLEKTLLANALVHSVLQGQACLLFWVSFDFLILHSYHLWWKRHCFFGASSKRCFKSSQNQSTFSFFNISGWDIDLHYCDIEWFTL